MQELIIESYGKVNLGLDVLYKREDGYHEIKSVMQEIALGDRLIFNQIDKGIIIESNEKEMPLDSRNLVYKVWKRLKAITGINKGIHVKIEKNIPLAAGLAGGSSNAAASLKALNQLWDLKFSQEELMTIGKELGADIPFCLLGGTALAQGIGEKLRKLNSFSDKYILLCNPGISISTPYVYRQMNLNGERLDIDGLIEGIKEDNIKLVAEKLANKMEDLVIGEYPIIKDIKETMMENGALGSLMSGSGPTVFGLYEDKEKMEYTHSLLSRSIKKVYMTKTK